MKFQIQFAVVDTAFAGARIFKGTISAGYNHVIPSQPIAKQVLKRKRKTVSAMPDFVVWMLSVTARTIMQTDIPVQTRH